MIGITPFYLALYYWKIASLPLRDSDNTNESWYFSVLNPFSSSREETGLFFLYLMKERDCTG